MWVLASVPFWIVGLLCFFSVGLAIAKSSRPTTDGDLVGIFGLLLISGIFFLIAAKIAS